jgi:hypothetical protein
LYPLSKPASQPASKQTTLVSQSKPSQEGSKQAIEEASK